MQVRLVESGDSSHVLKATVVSKRLNVVTLKHVWRQGAPFCPERFWTSRFDVRTGLDLGDQGAFRVHPDDLPRLQADV